MLLLKSSDDELEGSLLTVVSFMPTSGLISPATPLPEVGTSVFCCTSSLLFAGGGRRDKSFLRLDKEASIDAPAKAEASLDLASICILFTGAFWASKMLTDDTPGAPMLSLESC
uniref:Uncharacterized protein n=2 Tax=Rhizophora mucronata TaxID=61149 RepID=A0A2P2MTP1_RHIMU